LRPRSGVLLGLLTRHVVPYKAAACGASNCMALSNEVAADAADGCALQTSSSLRLSRGHRSKNSYRRR
jgi:hypothetical protein